MRRCVRSVDVLPCFAVFLFSSPVLTYVGLAPTSHSRIVSSLPFPRHLTVSIASLPTTTQAGTEAFRIFQTPFVRP